MDLAPLHLPILDAAEAEEEVVVEEEEAANPPGVPATGMARVEATTTVRGRPMTASNSQGPPTGTGPAA